MKAAVTRTFGGPLEIEDVTLGAPGTQEVRVRVGAVAICGSDIHAIDGAWGGGLPVVYGHEAAGVVAELGPEAAGLEVGDHVVVSLLRTCRTCWYCARGETIHCDTTFPLDRESRLRAANDRAVVQGIGVGAFAEEVVVHQSQVASIQRSIPLDAASLLACGVPTGYGAVVNTAQVSTAASVAVVGVGGVGMNCIQGAKAAGASTIVAIDTNDGKLQAARQFGATHAVAAGPDAADAVAAATAGRGADYVFAAVGNPHAIQDAFELARPGGSLVVVGMSKSGTNAEFDMAMFAYDAKQIIGSRMGSTDVARDTPRLAQRYLDGDLLLDELISGRFALNDINEAVAVARRGDTFRNVVIFEGVGA